MPIITLTTDWNKEDFYIGALKGKILSQCKEVRIADITHNIKPFNIPQAAFILRNSYKHFPKGTIHIIGVKSEWSPNQNHIAVKYDDHFFIGADNGIFGLLLKEKEATLSTISHSFANPTFPEFSVFADAACKIIKGTDIKELGEPKKQYNKKIPLRPTIDESVIIGKIVYIDSFSNAITNITKDLFNRICNKRSFHIFVQSNTNRITKINKTYNETSEGEILALFNSLDLLEIAMNGGPAAQILSLDLDSTVRVRFL